MKKLAIALIFNAIGIGTLAQNPNLPTERCLIVKKNNKQIKGVRLWNIGNGKLEYEKEGSLHDVSTDDIEIIKTKDEMISFDISGKMIIRPYDLIFTNGDTIKCVITKMNATNIYYLKQKGNKKYDYIPRSVVQDVIRVSDTLVFHEISDRYYEIIKSLERQAAERKITAIAKVEITDTENENDRVEASESYVKEEVKAVEEIQEDPSVGSGSGTDTGPDTVRENQEPTQKFYADKYNNNDLILTRDGRAIICRIDKVTTNRIYYHISQPGPNPDGYVDRSDVLKYVDTPPGPRLNSDTIFLNSGNSFTCKIREVKDGRIHYIIYKRGPETRASVDLRHVKSYKKKPIAEFTESELKSARTTSSAIKPILPATASSTDSKVNPGIAVGQFFAGTGVGLVVGGIGFLVGSIITDDFSANSINLTGYTIGSTIGATAMVAVVGLASKNTKSSFGATVLGAFIGSLGGMLVMNQLPEIDSFQGQVAGALAGGTLPAIGAMIGHHVTREPKKSNFNVQMNYNRVGLTYNF